MSDISTPPWYERPAVLLALFLALAGLLAARDPSNLLRAELWAEDGWAWYPEAYIYGLPTLWAPVAGYLQTVSRLVALTVQAMPFHWTPTVFNAAALAIQILPPLFLVSGRMARAWPHAPSRFLFAVIWVALPNTREVAVNLTNAQWHLATLAFLILVSAAPRGWLGRVSDTVALVVSGLSGPFCVLLAPVALTLAVLRRDRTSLYRALLVLAASALQALFVLRTIGDRGSVTLGAGPRRFARIVSQQVLLGPLIGQDNMTWLQSWWLWENNVAPVTVLLVAFGLIAVALWRGPPVLRLACLFAGLLLAAALYQPLISLTESQWPLMTLPGVGQRYYYIPMLAWLGVLFTLAGGWAGRRGIVLQGLACVLLAAVSFGIWTDWNLPQRRPTGFVAQARAFEAASSGTRMSFPINPLMDAVPMVLQKR